MSDVMQNLPSSLRQKLSEMGKARVQSLPLRDNGWLADAVGVLVVGASYLLGGAPGSRKSGLATQVALDLARQGKRVLIVPTEEPADRVWERLLKMMDGFSVEDINVSMQNLFVERNPPSVEQLPNYVSRQILSPSALYHGIASAVLDSVQGHGLVSAATRAYDRVLEATRLLSSANVTSLLVNHLTKRNELAGPRTLEHGVDCVLMLRKTPSCRLLFTLKNRHGPASLRDPVALLSSYLRRPIPPNCLFLGEVDLGRGIRPVDDRLLNELLSDLAAGTEMSGKWNIYRQGRDGQAQGPTPTARRADCGGDRIKDVKG